MIENYKKQDLEEENKRIQQTEGPTNFADVLNKETKEESTVKCKELIIKGNISPVNEQAVGTSYEETPSLRVAVKTAPWDDGGFDSSFMNRKEDLNERKRRKNESLNSNKQVFFV